MEFIWFIILIAIVAGSASKKSRQSGGKNIPNIYAPPKAAPPIKPQIKYSGYEEVNPVARNREVEAARKSQVQLNEQKAKQQESRTKEADRRRAQDEYQRKLQERQDQEKARKEALKKQREESQRRAQASSSAILNRSIANTKEENTDTLRQQLESEHWEDYTTGAYYQPKVEEGSLLAGVYERMITGYESKLSYERDFLDEGMTALARIQALPETAEGAYSLE